MSSSKSDRAQCAEAGFAKATFPQTKLAECRCAQTSVAKPKCAQATVVKATFATSRSATVHT